MSRVVALALVAALACAAPSSARPADLARGFGTKGEAVVAPEGAPYRLVADPEGGLFVALGTRSGTVGRRVDRRGGPMTGFATAYPEGSAAFALADGRVLHATATEPAGRVTLTPHDAVTGAAGPAGVIELPPQARGTVHDLVVTADAVYVSGSYSLPSDAGYRQPLFVAGFSRSTLAPLAAFGTGGLAAYEELGRVRFLADGIAVTDRDVIVPTVTDRGPGVAVPPYQGELVAIARTDGQARAVGSIGDVYHGTRLITDVRGRTVVVTERTDGRLQVVFGSGETRRTSAPVALPGGLEPVGGDLSVVPAGDGVVVSGLGADATRADHSYWLQLDGAGRRVAGVATEARPALGHDFAILADGRFALGLAGGTPPEPVPVIRAYRGDPAAFGPVVTARVGLRVEVGCLRPCAGKLVSPAVRTARFELTAAGRTTLRVRFRRGRRVARVAVRAGGRTLDRVTIRRPR